MLARVRPTHAELLEVAFAMASVGLGIIGFRTAFAGHEEITVGLPAVGLGVVVGYVLGKLRPPVLVGAAIAVLAFFCLAGLAGMHTHAIAGVIPTPSLWSDVIDGSVNGWARLLTTVPPAGRAGNLLAVPYLAGFAGGLLATVLALSVRRFPVCVVPGTAVLALSVLFGVDHPAALVLQGGIFGAATIAWLSLRGQRHRAPLPGAARLRRLASAALVLALCVSGASLLGPRLPLANANPRYVLRDDVQPPFDPSQYPSPLGRFRQFHGDAPIKDTLFTVEGLHEGDVIRFAVMDAYDGYVWRALPPGSAAGGTYEHVGPRIPNATNDAERRSLHFTMGALASSDSVWIPTAGNPTAISFTGPNASRLTNELRFNRSTESAASPVPLVPGDQWTVDTSFVAPPKDADIKDLPADPGVVVAKPQVEDAIAGMVATWLKDANATTPFQKVVAIETKLKKIGAYNDGKEKPIASGHSLARLGPFLKAQEPQGNGEQYAAAVAYLAQFVGVPARVVLEFAPPGSGTVEVKAHDARAEVEVALKGVGWVRVGEPTPPESQTPKTQVQQKQQKAVNEVQPPPPTTAPPPNSLPQSPATEKRVPTRHDSSAASRILGFVIRVVAIGSVPVIVVGAPCLLIVAIKRRRRARRRTTGTPATRVAGAWSDVVDLARDLGNSVPPKATRREIGRFVPPIARSTFPEDIDQVVFGHEDPDEAAALAMWERADHLRAEMLSDLSRAERIKTAVSLTSLR